MVVLVFGSHDVGTEMSLTPTTTSAMQKSRKSNFLSGLSGLSGHYQPMSEPRNMSRKEKNIGRYCSNA